MKAGFGIQQSKPPLTALKTERPLVSVIMFCRNRAKSVGRAIESVLNQTYPHWELVIQDGASTDGTREVIESHCGDRRIKLISEKDSGPFEAMWRAFRRGEGEVFASCLSDEELLPDALNQGVDYLLFNPNAAALLRDVLYTDLNGNPLQRANGDEFNFVDYMAMQFGLALCTMLFRRDALSEIGYLSRSWRLDCADFELLVRLGEDHQIDYYPGVSAKYAQFHEDQLSTNPELSFRGAAGQLRFINDFFLEDAPRKPFADLRSFPLNLSYNKLKKLYHRQATPELERKLDELFAGFDVTIEVSPLVLARQAVSIGLFDLARSLLGKIPENHADRKEADQLESTILASFGLMDNTGQSSTEQEWNEIMSSYRSPDAEGVPCTGRRLDSRTTFSSWAPGPCLNKAVLEAWAKILHLLPQSRLLISNEDCQSSDVRRSIRSFFQQNGVQQESLLILPKVSEEVSPNFLAQTDIYLDTFPVNYSWGLAWAMDHARPAVTLFRATVSESPLFRRLSESDGIVQDPSSYIVKAVKTVRRLEAL